MPRPFFIFHFQRDGLFIHFSIFENLSSAGSKKQEIKLFWPYWVIKNSVNFRLNEGQEEDEDEVLMSLPLTAELFLLKFQQYILISLI